MSSTKLNLARASTTRGEPPSFARCGPSREGLETLPGFPLQSKQRRLRLIGLTRRQESRDPIGRHGGHACEAHAERTSGLLRRYDFSGSRDDVVRARQLKLQPNESSRSASAATDGVDAHAGPTDVGSSAKVGVAAQKPIHQQIDFAPRIGTTLTRVARNRLFTSCCVHVPTCRIQACGCQIFCISRR